MSSIYDEVHREAMADRRNGADAVEPDRPDPSEYADRPDHPTADVVTPRYHFAYGSPAPTYDPATDPF